MCDVKKFNAVGVSHNIRPMLQFSCWSDTFADVVIYSMSISLGLPTLPSKVKSASKCFFSSHKLNNLYIHFVQPWPAAFIISGWEIKMLTSFLSLVVIHFSLHSLLLVVKKWKCLSLFSFTSHNPLFSVSFLTSGKEVKMLTSFLSFTSHTPLFSAPFVVSGKEMKMFVSFLFYQSQSTILCLLSH